MQPSDGGEEEIKHGRGVQGRASKTDWLMVIRTRLRTRIMLGSKPGY